MSLTFGLCLFVSAVHLLIDRVVGRFVPSLRKSGGAATLTFACLPWLCAVLILLLIGLDD